MRRILIRRFLAAPVAVATTTATLVLIGLTGGAAPGRAASADAASQTTPVPGAGIYRSAALRLDGRAQLIELASARATRARAARVKAAKATARHRSALTGTPREIGRELSARRGWTGSQWSCLDNLWTRESGWHVHNENGSSGAYGIPQALPATKMAATGSNWRDSALTQIRWGLGYIATRYGTPCDAWQHSQADNYY